MPAGGSRSVALATAGTMTRTTRCRQPASSSSPPSTTLRTPPRSSREEEVRRSQRTCLPITPRGHMPHRRQGSRRRTRRRRRDLCSRRAPYARKKCRLGRWHRPSPPCHPPHTTTIQSASVCIISAHSKIVTMVSYRVASVSPTAPDGSAVRIPGAKSRFGTLGSVRRICHQGKMLQCT